MVTKDPSNGIIVEDIAKMAFCLAIHGAYPHLFPKMENVRITEEEECFRCEWADGEECAGAGFYPYTEGGDSGTVYIRHVTDERGYHTPYLRPRLLEIQEAYAKYATSVME